MPQHAGSSDKARQANIREEIRAGKPVKQAVAIGYSEQRQARKHEGHMSGKKEHHGHTYEGDGKQKHGADGSHQHSRNKVGGSRQHIHEGMPSELESHHHKDGDRS